MSKKFLEKLNGNSCGNFRKWLNDLIPEPKIAWYPSAGEDFRDLLFLSERYSDLNRGETQDPPAPHIFLHTDYFPYEKSELLKNKNFNIDDRTRGTIKNIEELPACDLPLDRRLVASAKGGPRAGRVFFLEIEVDSPVLGKFTAPVLYVFAENTAFCAQMALPEGAKFSHILHVRYGGGCGGGGYSTGVWLLNVLKKLDCEVFVTDGHYHMQSGDEAAFKLYPAVAGDPAAQKLERYRLIPGSKWSSHGDVTWNLVK